MTHVDPVNVLYCKYSFLQMDLPAVENVIRTGTDDQIFSYLLRYHIVDLFFIAERFPQLKTFQVCAGHIFYMAHLLEWKISGEESSSFVLQMPMGSRLRHDSYTIQSIFEDAMRIAEDYQGSIHAIEGDVDDVNDFVLDMLESTADYSDRYILGRFNKEYANFIVETFKPTD